MPCRAVMRVWFYFLFLFRFFFSSFFLTVFTEMAYIWLTSTVRVVRTYGIQPHSKQLTKRESRTRILFLFRFSFILFVAVAAVVVVVVVVCFCFAFLKLSVVCFTLARAPQRDHIPHIRRAHERRELKEYFCKEWTQKRRRKRRGSREKNNKLTQILSKIQLKNIIYYGDVCSIACVHNVRCVSHSQCVAAYTWLCACKCL